MTKYSQEDNYQYFLDNQDMLIKKHPDKFLVIKDKKVIGVYDDQVTAYTESTREHDPHTFIIQRATPQSTDVQVFNSRVVSA